MTTRLINMKAMAESPCTRRQKSCGEVMAAFASFMELYA